MTVAIASDEFIDILPSKYKKEIDYPNVLLSSQRKIDIGKTIPIPVMISTLKKMKTLKVFEE